MLTCGQTDWIVPHEKSELFAENDVILADDGHILSGSTEALLRRLIPTRTYTPDSRFVFCVLVNLRTMLSPQEIMQRLVQKSMFSVNADSSNFRGGQRSELFAQLLAVCQQWATAIPYDFRHPHMFSRLKELVGLCAVDAGNRQKAAVLLGHLSETLKRLEQYEAPIPPVAAQQGISQSDQLSGLMAISTNATVIARQLTIIELERFALVGLDEVVEALARGDVAKLAVHSTADRPFSAISHYMDWFNRLSSLAATEILRHSRRRHRVQVVEFLTDVARQCCQMGNFNSLMALVAGLSLPAVARLKRTWSRVDKEKLDILQHQLDPSGNFLSYRATLKAAIWRAAGGTGQQKMVIPFFLLLLKDLFLIFHSTNRVLPNGHVNVVALSSLSDHLREMLSWQQVSCPFYKDTDIQEHLLHSPLFPDNEAQLISFELEAAESSNEREQLRRLRSASKTE